MITFSKYAKTEFIFKTRLIRFCFIHKRITSGDMRTFPSLLQRQSQTQMRSKSSLRPALHYIYNYEYITVYNNRQEKKTVFYWLLIHFNHYLELVTVQ